MILMSHVKEFMKVFTAATLQATANKANNGQKDHDYAIQDTE